MNCRKCGSSTIVRRTCDTGDRVLRLRKCMECNESLFTEEKKSEHPFDTRHEINQVLNERWEKRVIEKYIKEVES